MTAVVTSHVAQSLLGRDAVLDELVRQLAACRDGSRVVGLVGRRGLGRTAVLDRIAGLAHDAGVTVLRTGFETVDAPALAAVHALFASVVRRSEPPVDHPVLAAVFGVEARAPGPDPGIGAVPLATALGELLAVSTDRPMVLLVDDHERLDDASRQTLEALADRLPPVGVLMLVAGAAHHLQVALTPLDDRDSAALLDRQPFPPCGSQREWVLDAAAGNPLAIVELAATLRRPGGRSARLTPRLIAAFGAGLGDLPTSTRDALRVAAALDSTPAGWADLVANREIWDPAVQAGMLVAGPTGPAFAHPVIPAVLLALEPPEARRTLDLRVQRLLGDVNRESPHRPTDLAEDAATNHDPTEAVLSALVEVVRRRDDPSRAALARQLDGLDPRRLPDLSFWAAVALEPGRYGPAARDRLRSRKPGDPAVDAAAAFAALLLDETAMAVSALTETVDRLGVPARPWHQVCRQLLPWVLLDAGRLQDAADAAGGAQRAAEIAGLRVGVGPAVVRSVLADLQDDRVTAARSVTVDSHRHPAVAVRLRHARALAAASVGDADEVWRLLVPLFDPGTPVPFELAVGTIGELAAAARSMERIAFVQALLDRSRTEGREVSLRRRLLLHRARALLAPAAEAEHHFRLALVHPGGEQWPIDRALARADYGRWLRRRRRPREARELFEAARDTFAVRGMSAWARSVETELAAAAAPSARPRGSSLTPQQHSVAVLAAGGATNQEIADQLGLSVRTVTSHLSRAFARLGVARRTQLAVALERG